MNYQDMKNKVFTTVSRPQGYYGNRAYVGLAVHDGYLYEVAYCGYYKSPVLPTVADEAEALWMLHNNPKCKKFYKQYQAL